MRCMHVLLCNNPRCYLLSSDHIISYNIIDYIIVILFDNRMYYLIFFFFIFFFFFSYRIIEYITNTSRCSISEIARRLVRSAMEIAHGI